LVDATESRACGAAPTRSHYPGAPSPSRWCFDHDLPVIPRGGGTGFTAGSIDFGGVLSNKLSVFIAIVVVLSALLLFAIFRSLVIPL
jgi:FAD/FMN-containing dehydrogenase